MSSTKMRRFIGLGVAMVLLVHFLLIRQWVVSYPSWGDDWGFILLFDTQLGEVFSSFSSYLVPFHGAFMPIFGQRSM